MSSRDMYELASLLKKTGFKDEIDGCLIISEEALLSLHPIVRRLSMSEFANLLKQNEFENMFIWKPHEYIKLRQKEDMITNMLDLISESEDETQFRFPWCMYNLIMSYEFYIQNKMAEALEIIEKLECHIADLKSRKCNESAFKMISMALDHIVLSTKVVLLKNTNFGEACKIYGSRMPHLREMNKSNLAGLKGVKAFVLGEYFENEACVETANEAISFDAANPYWHFIKGKYMRRVRKVKYPFEGPDEEEIEAVETAIEFSDIEYAPFFLLAARAYQDVALHMRPASAKEKSDQLNEMAVEYYKKAVQLNPNCSQIKFRVAKGFLRFRYPLKDEKYAETLLEEGLKIAPNNCYGLYQMALYQERCKNNKEEAKMYLKKCLKIFDANLDLLRLDYEKNQSIDVIMRLNRLYERFESSEQRLLINIHKLSYYLFNKNNIERACHCMFEVIQKNRYHKRLYNHESLFFDVLCSINLPDVLADELDVILESTRLTEIEYRKYYSLRLKIDKYHTPLTNYNCTLINLRSKILDEARFLKSYVARGTSSSTFCGPYSEFLKYNGQSIPTHRNHNFVSVDYGSVDHQNASNSKRDQNYGEPLFRTLSGKKARKKINKNTHHRSDYQQK